MPPDLVDEPSSLVLSYYKSRIDAFDKERDELLARISNTQSSATEVHTLRCESQQRAREVRELQKALSDAHVHLFEERERLLRTQAELDEVKLQEVEDRRRIQHLLALTQPVEQEITLTRDDDPRSGVLFPQKRQSKPRAPGGAGPAEHAPSVIRTVYLPAANADSLMLKVESLQAQLNEQSHFARERVAALLEDRRIRESDEEAHRSNFQTQIEALTTKLRRTEEALRTVTTDYILARRDKQAAEGRAVNAEAALESERKAAAAKLGEVKRGLEEKIAKLKLDSEAKHTKDVDHYQKQLKVRDQSINQLESMHSAVKAQYEQRIVDLETRYGKTKDKLKQVEYRRVLDMEGFTNDVSQLRKQLAAVDRKLHQMRLLDRLEDDQRLQSLLRNLENRAPTLPITGGSAQNANDTSSETSEAIIDLKGIKTGLLGIEDKLRRSVLRPR